ncbi:MAG: quinone-dependent dihydroorotate dehydrogenase [Kiritimatiellae bacterium]|nr:quinone-dependent dihydroorotate dehydrogenase [Kiritimatiellia bacterium]
MIYPLIKKILFQLDAEKAHTLSLNMLSGMHRVGLTSFLKVKDVNKPRQVMGLTFPNPVGLAAGMDKDGRCIDALGSLGFGFIEVGTVTPKPQRGHDKPRLFRIPESDAIINRMGFNNDGVEACVNRLRERTYKGVLGVNIGKNIDTPAAAAVTDYLICMRTAYPVADYIAINISSPNTPGLRDMQDDVPLSHLLDELKEAQKVLSDQYQKYVPIAIKMAPDLTADQVENFARLILMKGADGVIATNTTTARDGVQGFKFSSEEGGMSGRPLKEKSTHIVQTLYEVLQGQISIIGVGGIMSSQDAKEKIKVGAHLVQIYSGLVYRGPQLIRDSIKGLSS